MIGFSLIELMLALTITLILGLSSFQLFRQSERVFHDQYLLRDVQQGARAAASQIADEIRVGGQGVPVYSATYDGNPSEGSVIVLAGSDATRLNLRAGISNAESHAVAPLPLNLIIGTTLSVTVGSASIFADIVGTNPGGRYVYIWGATADMSWGWVRASINSIIVSTNTLQITPVETGSGGRLAGPDGVLNTPDDVVRFTASPYISLEEAIAIYYDSAGAAIRRTTASNLTNPINPTWAAANELAVSVISLAFTYYDRFDNPIAPSSLANRAAVARVDARLIMQTSEALSDGKRATVSLPVRSVVRNAQIR